MTGKKTTEVITKTVKKTYKLLYGDYKEKNKAKNDIIEANKKGFKGATLIIRNNKFKICFGTFKEEKIAQLNLTVVKGAGFDAEIVEG